jgi:small-conductance mechanosensitive channel
MRAVALLLGLTTAAAAQDHPWTGHWDTFWREGAARMVLEQSGTTVTGTYEPGGGRIVAEADGRRLAGEWREDEASGEIAFALSEDGGTFTGRFASGEYWNGARVAADAGDGTSPVRAESPRAALHRFVRLQNAIDGGSVAALRGVEDVLLYEDGARDGRAARVRRQLLWSIVDLSTFRVHDAPREGEGDAASFRIGPSGAIHDHVLRFVRAEDGWRLLVPSEEALRAEQAAMVEARGYDDLLDLQRARADSPRAAMQDFIVGVHDWEGEGGRRAVDRLDLSFLPPRLAAFDAPILAEYLKQVIDRAGYVTWQEIPDDPDRAVPYVFYNHPAGAIVIDRLPAPEEGVEDPGPRWRFTPDTLRSAPALYTEMQDLELAEGLGTQPPITHAFTLRETARSLSPALLTRVGGMDLWQLLVLPLALLSVVLVSLGMGRAVPSLAGRFVPDTSDAGPDPAATLRRPAMAFALTGALLGAFIYLGLAQTVIGMATLGLAALTVIAATWFAFSLVHLLGRASQDRAARTTGFVDEIMTSLVTGLLKVAVVVAGIVALADVIGLPYEGVIAGLGVGGVALAFASRETVTNMIGGAILMTDRPFARGDLIETDGAMASVEHVGLRSTRLRTPDDSLRVVPNAQLTDRAIVNWGRRRKRQTRLTIGLTYDTPREKLDAFVARLRELYLSQPFADPDTGYVGLKSFGPSSLDIELWGYFTVSGYDDHVAAQHRLIGDIVDLAKELVVQFAFPTQTVILSGAET